MNNRIRAAKADGKYLISCDINDPKASYFEVYYSNNYQCRLRFDTLYKAQEVALALDSEHNAGKLAKLAELHNFLGIK